MEEKKRKEKEKKIRRMNGGRWNRRWEGREKA
jgi:hypothetical protein